MICTHLRPFALSRSRIRCSSNDASRINIGGGDSIKIPQKRTGMRPRIDLTKHEAVELQLEVKSILKSLSNLVTGTTEEQ